MYFKNRYNETKEYVESNILKHIAKYQHTKQNLICDAMKYSLLAGGKRFRPILHLETVRLLGGNVDDFYDTALALEYIHTYSLIHDDLPAMDNDDYRRGVPTNHKVFGEGIAVLAGDGLLNSAMDILFKKVCDDTEPHIAKGVSLISRSAGVSGMIGGQVLDITNENKKIDIETLIYLHSKKTGALIEASVLAPAIMLQATEEQKVALEIYSKKIGLAFQISDDILDVEGSFEELGKPIGSDEENCKSTFVTYYGVEGAKKILAGNIDEAVDALKIFKEKEFLVELAKYIATRKN